jgi:hypothetical protein
MKLVSVVGSVEEFDAVTPSRVGDGPSTRLTAGFRRPRTNRNLDATLAR